MDEDTNPHAPRDGRESPQASQPDEPALRLTPLEAGDSVSFAMGALDQAQRRMDNLRDLLHRFDLDGDDDDGPRAA